MMEFTCPHCGHTFQGSVAFNKVSWYSFCPECGRSFNTIVPQGNIILAFAKEADGKKPYENFTEDIHDACVSSFYAFSSREEFLKMWEKKVYKEKPDGMWYWIIEDGHNITCGGPNPQDIELICDAWGVVADDSYDIGVLLDAAKAFCKPGAKLYAVDIEWDVDEEDNNNLPSRIEIPANMTDEDEISEYITNVASFCHCGFRLEYKAGDTRYPENAVFSVSGDSKDLWIEDYNVRASTVATVLEMPRKTDKKVLVSLADIDGDNNVTTFIKKSALKKEIKGDVNG